MGHNIQMAVFTTACFFSPQPAPATQLPTECICSNTINVTFADCLLAFYLNGNSALPAAAAAATTASSSCSAAVPLCSALASSAFSISLHPGAVKRATTPAVTEWWEACVSLGGLGRALRAIQECFLLGGILFSLCLPSLRLSSCQQKCKTMRCCDGTERQMIAGVRNSWF